MITCDEFLNKASEYLDGELPPETTAECSRHLASCAACARECADIRRAEAQFRLAVPDLAPSPALWRSIKLGVRPHRRTDNWWAFFLRPIALTVATLLLLTIGFFLLLQRERGEALKMEIQAFQMERKSVVQQGNPYGVNQEAQFMSVPDENPFSPYLRVRADNPFKEMD